ncbi:serine protease, partial [Streptomyces misionensis]
MKKPLVGALFAVLLLGAGVAPATAATAHEATSPGAVKEKVRPKAVNFAGTVALSNCSGSVVRTPDSQPD